MPRSTASVPLKTTDDIVCRQCGGLNEPDDQYCWHCGAPLRGLLRRPRRNREVRWGVRALKWVLGLAVTAGVLYGIYYGVDRFLLPLFEDDKVQVEAVTTTTSTTVRPSTTTTTIAREDILVAGGKDRYSTAAAVSQYGFPSGVPAVVLAGGGEYADAISAVPLAAALEAPVLLLPPEGVRADIGAELKRLGPSRVFLVGVSRASTVKRQLRDLLEDPEVKDLTGDDPYETATLVAAEMKAELGTVTRVVVAPADSFVEGLAAAPLAGAKGWPILLVPPDAVIRKATLKSIEELEVDSALMVGTFAKLSLGEVERLVGTDSFDTAALVIDYAAQNGSSFAHTAIVTGDNFPDGLVTDAYLAKDGGVLLPAQKGQLPPPLLSLFEANLESIRKLEFFALPSLKKELTAPSALP